jgi:hypothetical protein
MLCIECPLFLIRSDESGLFTVHITLLKKSAFLLSGPEFRHFLIRSDELELFYYKNHTAQTIFISVVYRISTLSKSFRIIGMIILYRSQRSNKFINDLSINSTFRDSFRRIGTIVLYRSHGSNKFHFCCGVYKFYFSWFVPTNWDYCTVRIAWLKHVSFLLYPKCRLFVIRSDESGLLYCTDHTSQIKGISVVRSRISTFHDSFRRIGTTLGYILHRSNHLHLCVQNFDFSWLVPTNRDNYSVRFTRLKQASFLFIQNFKISWLVPSNQDYSTVLITRLKKD